LAKSHGHEIRLARAFFERHGAANADRQKRHSAPMRAVRGVWTVSGSRRTSRSSEISRSSGRLWRVGRLNMSTEDCRLPPRKENLRETRRSTVAVNSVWKSV